jgi:hypothetical protein
MDLAVVKESQIGRVVNKIKQDHANEGNFLIQMQDTVC